MTPPRPHLRDRGVRAWLGLAMVLLVVACGGPASSASPGATAGAIPSPGASGAPSTDPGGTPSDAPSGLTLGLETVVEGLDGPLDIAVRPGDPDALYVLEQVGRVRVVRGGALVEAPVLDIRDLVSAGGERGLLGFAFHPDPDDPRLFLYYTDRAEDQVLAVYRMDGPDLSDPASGRILLTMADEFGNHNGGSLAFGPDGHLYVGTGDGGGGGDPLDSGRRLDTLLAKVLRLDVGAADATAYGIPDDNPFLGVDGALPEIWHTGLRNPWRLRFDRATGDLWIGDVGQGAWEEIDRAPAGTGGLDFGWNITEGFHCFDGDGAACEDPALTAPIAEYGHDQGCSVTGGTVYRGTDQPALTGRYVFSDYCSGIFWVLDADAAADGGRQEPQVVLESGRNISAIAEDASGELFATDLGGELLRIVVAGG